MNENNLPKFVDDKNGFTRAWNKLLDWCRRNTLQSSSDILVTQTTHGTSLSLVRQPASISQPQGSISIVQYDTSGNTPYAGGTVAFVTSKFTLNSVTVLPGTYGLLSSQKTPASPTGNQIPQIPVPTSGTVYWIPIAAGMIQTSTCVTGTSKNVYINATDII
jgi:hypothetical protein